MKDKFKKITKIVLVMMMILTSTVKVHAEPRDGDGGGGNNQWSQEYYPNSAHLTYDKETKIYTIISTDDLSVYDLTSARLCLQSSNSIEAKYINLNLQPKSREGSASNEYIYTFSADSIEDFPEGINGDYYIVELTLERSDGTDTYLLTSRNQVWFEKEAIPFNNDLINKDSLKIEYNQNDSKYIISHVDGKEIYFNRFGEGVYRTELMFYNDYLLYKINVYLYSEDNKNYTFDLNDFELNWKTILGGDYHLVTKCSIDERQGYYALTNSKLTLPTLKDSTISFERVEDVECTTTLVDNKFVIETSEALTLGNSWLEVNFVKPENDGLYQNFGTISLMELKNLGNNQYYFTLDDISYYDEVIPEGNYELYLSVYVRDSAGLVYNLTGGNTIGIPQINKYVPSDFEIKYVENQGIVFSTKNPTDTKAQEWFNSLLNGGYVEIGVSQIDYERFESIKENDIILGVVISEDTLVENSVLAGMHRINVYSPNYQKVQFDYFKVNKGALNPYGIQVSVSQDEKTKDLIFKSDNTDFLSKVSRYSIEISDVNYSGFGEMIGYDGEFDEEKAVFDKEKGELRILFERIEELPANIPSMITIKATGYADKIVSTDFEFETFDLKRTDAFKTIIITSNGLVLRSEDKAYLEALNTPYDEENHLTTYTKVSFNGEIGKPIVIDNTTGNIFEGVYEYSGKNKGYYYTLISSDTIEKLDFVDDRYYSIEFKAAGYVKDYTDNESFDITNIIQLFEKVENNKDKELSNEELSQLDKTISELNNVTVNSSTTNDYDENITIDGIVTGVVITDNEGGIDKDTLAYEDGEIIDVNVNVEESEEDATDETFGMFQIMLVNKSFNITVTRNVNNGGNENIIELPLHVMVEIGDCELEEGNVLKILKTHTDSNGQTSQELLDVYYNQETKKYYFYTDQFSNFQVVQAKETSNEGEETPSVPSSPGTALPEPEINTEVEKLPTVDTTKPVDKVTVGTSETAKEVLNNTVKEIIEAVKENEKVTNLPKEVVDKIKEEYVKGNDVDLVAEVVVKTLEEKEVAKETVKKISETVKYSKVAQYLDLSVLLKVVVNDKVLANGNVTELSKPITFTIAIPEELARVEKGYEREYFVIREHDGKIDKLPVTVNKDGSLSFTTDKFSTYALVYVDTQVEVQPEVTPEVKPTTPETGDNSYVMVFALAALVSLAIIFVLKKKEEFNK